MEEFALYLFKSVVWLAGFTLIFILFLKNERFFLLNRIYLIAGILTSFIFPAISIHYTVIVPATANLHVGSQGFSETLNIHQSIMPDLKTLLIGLYFLGTGIVVFLAIRQGRNVFMAIKKSEVISMRPVKLIKTSEYTSAFSFFSYVFVNPSLTDIETKEIMIHEMVHIRQKHWFDLLLVELLRIMQWFNPCVWIYVRFIRQNHEYLADKVALQQTSDPAIYKAVLLNQIIGAPVISLTNSFSYSPNKKRFYMMKNIITSPYRKMKVLLILPVFAFVLFAFAKPEYKYLNQTVAGSTASDTTKQKKREITQAPGSPVRIINSDGSVPLYVVDGVIVTKEEADKIVSQIKSVNVIKDIPNKYGEQGKNGVIEITLKKDDKEFEHAAFPDQSAPAQPDFEERNKSEKKPLVVIDGVVREDFDLNKLDPAKVQSVVVWTDKDATDKFGDKAKDGALEISMKIAPEVEIRSENDVKPLILIDGVETEKAPESIGMEKVESISVITNVVAVRKYGDKGKNGAVEIVLKKEIQVEK